MRTLELNEMETIQAAGGRTCLILGGLTAASAIVGIFVPPVFGATAVLAGSAATNGCFE